MKNIAKKLFKTMFKQRDLVSCLLLLEADTRCTILFACTEKTNGYI